MNWGTLQGDRNWVCVCVVKKKGKWREKPLHAVILVQFGPFQGRSSNFGVHNLNSCLEFVPQIVLPSRRNWALQAQVLFHALPCTEVWKEKYWSNGVLGYCAPLQLNMIFFPEKYKWPASASFPMCLLIFIAQHRKRVPLRRFFAPLPWFSSALVRHKLGVLICLPADCLAASLMGLIFCSLKPKGLWREVMVIGP